MNSTVHILTLILQDTPGGNTVTCTSVIETLKWHIFNWKTSIFELELQDTTLTIKQIIRQLFKDLIVSITKIIPDLSQIQFFLQVVPASNQCLPYRPMWHPMSFSPAKRVCYFCCLIFALQTTLISGLAVCFHCFMFPCFACFHIFHIGQRRGVLRVSMFFPKGVQLQLDEWPWNGEGVLGSLRCMGTQCWVERQLKQKPWKSCWIKIGYCWLFLKVLYDCSHILDEEPVHSAHVKPP